MKNSILTIFLFLISLSNAFAQDCGERYKEPVFDLFTLTPQVLFGNNTTALGVPQPLFMDIYQPFLDQEQKRPLIIMAFGGSFTFGDKKSPDIVQLAEAFVRRGYVVASIDYRLGFENFPPNTQQAAGAVVRAVHDGKASVRHLKRNAATYRIDTNKIAFLGVSAGGFIGLHLQFLDRKEEIADIIDIETFGGIEGNTNAGGISSKVNVIVNLCGAIGRAGWIDNDIVPIFSMHGTNDATVPYGRDDIALFGSTLLTVDGSFAIDTFAKKRGLPHKLYTFLGAGHVPFVPLGPAIGEDAITASRYMDTTIRETSDFLYKNIICGTVTSTEPLRFAQKISVYPNPVVSEFYIQLPDVGNETKTIRIYDVMGKEVIVIETNQTNKLTINSGDLLPGLYTLIIKEKDKVYRSTFVKN